VAGLPLAAGEGEIFDELPLEQAAPKATTSAKTNGKAGRIFKLAVFLIGMRHWWAAAPSSELGPSAPARARASPTDLRHTSILAHRGTP